ncbi:brachyurin-like [Zophobas morio]|uniref:brachyurin-like n=1 Tax=Zophobas morio TaxID=2755281 RepID=UPI00308281EB
MRVFLAICVALTGVAVSAAPQVSTRYRSRYAKALESTHNAPKPRIDGGQEAVPHSFPYQVFVELYYSPSYGTYCGGVLISANYVLTAAHCIDSIYIAYVILGAHNLKQTENTAVLRISEEMKPHENFSVFYYPNDIALIKLSESVEFTDAIQPVALPKRSDVDNTFVDAVGTISGWGATDYVDDSMSSVLNYVNVKVITNRSCRLVFGGLVVDSMVCTSGLNHASTCLGDNGGPLVVNGVLVGIASYYSEGCGDLEAPSGFTRVTSFLDWIEENSDVVIE